MRRLRTSLPRLAAGLVGLALPGVGPALGATYDFVPAPQIDLNRIYRIDRVTGEVSSCQYGLQEGTVGVTLCFGAGDGAGPQPPGEYALIASRHEREAGIFRANLRTGQVSVCYVLEDRVVCTPQTGPGAVSSGPPSGPALGPASTGLAPGVRPQAPGFGGSRPQ